MFNVCPQCGTYEVEKEIIEIDTQSFAQCSHCNHHHPFHRLPLFILTGASCTGKSTTALHLQQHAQNVVVLENDLYHLKELTQDYFVQRELILRTCKNVAQAGKPILLEGCNIPEHFEKSLEKRYFSKFHYLAIVCSDSIHRQRMKERPEWRGFNTEEQTRPHLEFNQWFWKNHNTPDTEIQLLDNSTISVEETAEKVMEWIGFHLS